MGKTRKRAAALVIALVVALAGLIGVVAKTPPIASAATGDTTGYGDHTYTLDGWVAYCYESCRVGPYNTVNYYQASRAGIDSGLLGGLDYILYYGYDDAQTSDPIFGSGLSGLEFRHATQVAVWAFIGDNNRADQLAGRTSGDNYYHYDPEQIYGTSWEVLRWDYSNAANSLADTMVAQARAHQNDTGQPWNGFARIYRGSGSQGLMFGGYRTGYLKVRKSANPSGITANASYSLVGAKYEVFKDQGCTDSTGCTFTIQDNLEGEGTLSLNPGTYYLKEIYAPSGFLLDTKVYSATVVSGDTVTADLSDDAVYGYVKVIKRNAANEVVTRSGFKFNLYKKGGNAVLGTAETGADGTAIFKKDGQELKLELGEYEIQETFAPEPFDLNSTRVTVKLEQKDPHSGTADLKGEGGQGDADKPVGHGYDDTVPGSVKDNQHAWIKVIKVNEETGEVVTEKGFKFDLYKADGTTKLASGVTDDTGTILFDQQVPVPGTYVVKEVEVPEPWNVTTKEFTVTLQRDGVKGDAKGTTNGDAANAHTGNPTPDDSSDDNIKAVIDNPVADAPQYGRVTLHKMDASDSQPQRDAEFQVILLDEGVHYTSQGGASRSPACDGDAVSDTNLTQGSSVFDPSNGKVTVTNPIMFKDANGNEYTNLKTDDEGNLTTPWLPIDKGGTSHYALVEVKTGHGHLIDGNQIPFELVYDASKKDQEGTVAAAVQQKEYPNLYRDIKKDELGNMLHGATISFWRLSDNYQARPAAGHDALAIRTPNTNLVPRAYQVIDGCEVDGSGIPDGYAVRLTNQADSSIVIDVDNKHVQHADIGSWNLQLLDDTGVEQAFTGPTDIETKEGSATLLTVTVSGLTGKTQLSAEVGEIQGREATFVRESDAWVAKNLKPASTYMIEFGEHVVKYLKTSDEGGVAHYARYAEEDSKWFCRYWVDQAALPKSDSNILTSADISGKEYNYYGLTGDDGILEVQRIDAGDYLVCEVKPPVDLVTHETYLPDLTCHTFNVDEVTGYITCTDEGLDDSPEADKSFEFVDARTKLRISKKSVTGDDELEGALLTLTAIDDDVVDEWTSTTETHYIEGLEPGTYHLTERVNPKDYDKATTITFDIYPTGEIQHVVMFDQPISIDAQIDKRQEIANPLDSDQWEPNAEENNANKQDNESGDYRYSLDFRSNSNTWTDEFTVEDPLEPATDGLARLTSITTPQAWQDYDGKMNVWYRTNKTDAAYRELKAEGDDEEEAEEKADATDATADQGDATADQGDAADQDDAAEETVTPALDTNGRPKVRYAANATLSDNHVNPWLYDDDAMAADEDGDCRVIAYDGWRLWEKDVPTSVATRLEVKDLGLADDEYVTGFRFEYGRVEVGFTTRLDEWDRENLKDPHDDLERITGTSSRSFADADAAADAAAARLSIISARFTTDASQALETEVAKEIKKAKEDYSKRLIEIDEYNAQLNALGDTDALPKFLEALEVPAYVDDADDVQRLDAQVAATNTTLIAAFRAGGSVPAGRVALLSASKDALADVRGMASEDAVAALEAAIAAYDTEMDRVPTPEGGEDMRVASDALVAALSRVVDEIRAQGLSGRVMYAPAVVEMRLTEAYAGDAVLHNSANVDAYRNGGNSDDENEKEGKLEGHDDDEVIQRLRKKELMIGTHLATIAGDKIVANDGSVQITLIDTVDYHGLIPGHEYEMQGVLHIRRGTNQDGGEIKGSRGTTRFTPDKPDGQVQVKLVVPAGSVDVAPTVAYEELRRVLPVTGKASDVVLAEHKDITDRNQTVQVGELAADLVKTGDAERGVVLIATTMTLAATAAMAWRRRHAS